MAHAESKMMTAVQYSKYGIEGLKHVQLPVPVPKKGELLVKVEATSVNPVDWKVQSGWLKFMLPLKFPYTPGTDISGQVVSVGPGVTGFAEGDKVVSWLTLKYGGGLAEYAIASPKFTAKGPPEMSAIDAACLPVAGMTALQTIRDTAGVKRLDGSYTGNVLVTAASGGVGVYAVQIAKLAGAHVTATCGARNLEFVKSLGADEVLDYKTPEGSSMVSPSGKKYDAVIHCASSRPFSAFQPVLSPRGKVIDLTPNFSILLTSALKMLTLSKQKIIPFFFMAANSSDLGLLLDLVQQGKLKTVIDSQFPLEKAEDAWSKSMEGRATGKIVVTAV